MKKLFLTHITSYSYINPVMESSNKILLYPFNDINQQVVSHEIEISENPKIFTYLDNFNKSRGNFESNSKFFLFNNICIFFSNVGKKILSIYFCCI